MKKKNASLLVIFFVIGIALAIFISTSAVKEAYRSRTIEREVENLKQEAKKIQNENSAMTERIAYLETPQFQEKIAKEKLNLQKPDENVVVVKKNIGDKAPLVEISDILPLAEDIPNYMKWWNAFFAY